MYWYPIAVVTILLEKGQQHLNGTASYNITVEHYINDITLWNTSIKIFLENNSLNLLYEDYGDNLKQCESLK